MNIDTEVKRIVKNIERNTVKADRVFPFNIIDKTWEFLNNHAFLLLLKKMDWTIKYFNKNSNIKFKRIRDDYFSVMYVAGFSRKVMEERIDLMLEVSFCFEEKSVTITSELPLIVTCDQFMNRETWNNKDFVPINNHVAYSRKMYMNSIYLRGAVNRAIHKSIEYYLENKKLFQIDNDFCSYLNERLHNLKHKMNRYVVDLLNSIDDKCETVISDSTELYAEGNSYYEELLNSNSVTAKDCAFSFFLKSIREEKNVRSITRVGEILLMDEEYDEALFCGSIAAKLGDKEAEKLITEAENRYIDFMMARCTE